jgi:hypothetical protein
MNEIKSAYLKLNWKDIRRGLAIGIGTCIPYLLGAMANGTIPDKNLFLSTLSVFAGAGGSYVFKNLFTNSNDEFLKKEQ